MTKFVKNKLSSKVVLIVGGASGIGFSLSQKFAASGCVVVIADRDIASGRKAVSKLKKENECESFFIKADLSKVNASSKLIADTYNLCGHIDILINNCRAGERRDFLLEDEKNWDITFEVMLKANFFLIQEMVKRKAKGRPGVVLNISSVLSHSVSMESPSYHCAKAGLEQLTRYLAVQAGPFGVRVNAIAPGFIVKEEHLNKFLSKNNKSFRSAAYHCHPLGQIGREFDLASAALYLCSEESAFVTGQTLVVDGGLTLNEPFNMVYSYNKKRNKK